MIILRNGLLGQLVCSVVLETHCNCLTENTCIKLSLTLNCVQDDCEIVQKNSVIEKITFDAMNNDIQLNIF